MSTTTKLVPIGYGIKLLGLSAPWLETLCSMGVYGEVKVDAAADDDGLLGEDRAASAHILDGDRITSFGSFCVYTNGLFEFLVLIKPKDDDMKKLEETVRSIKVAGLFWGASKLVPIGYEIKLLGIECTVVGHLVDDDDDDDLFGEDKACSWNASSKNNFGLVFLELYGDNSDIKKLEEYIRSLQTEGMVWRTFGYGFKFLQMVFTVFDDHLCFNTVIKNTGGPCTKYVSI
ncbi:hypothetical protein DY000_02002216 [Brassica cretica]|uniref:Translation elongation factor EF1B beta/delta subunit guanine nucleotide exchange domain-containing protein n=1 Tax=Brassica cretica TaxID=69181 RepID=A0ABQ7C2K9_BRACR|nr:hypothetical protein DY000_02002216 [Brassica cretica]